MKRIFAISDLHGNLCGLNRGNVLNPAGHDAVVIAGDIAPLSYMFDLEEQYRWFETEFNAWVTQFPDIPFVMIPGNHDIRIRDDRSAIEKILPKNCHILIDEEKTIAGIRFYGTPWVPVINHRWAYEGFSLVLRERFSHIPSGVDVLITHTPPFVPGHSFDVALQYGGTTHFGSIDLATSIRIKKPRYCFFGHVHSGDHTPDRIWGTRCWNVSRLNEDYRPHYDPVSIEIEERDNA